MVIKRFFILLIIFTLTGFAYAEEAVTLTIAGNASSEKIDAYSQSHPGVAIKWMSVEDDTELIQEALSRSDTIDVYCLDSMSSITYRNLRDKGYFMVLDDPEILKIIGSCYPELQQMCTAGGEFCAVPFGMIGQAILGVDLDVWYRLGLSDEDLPDTWPEALRFMIERWPDIAAEHENVCLFQIYDRDEQMGVFLHWIEHDYEGRRMRSNYTMGYDTPEFRETLTLFEQLYAMLEEYGRDDAEYTLFESGYVPTVSESWMNKRGLPLAFKEGETPCWPVDVLLLAINPESKHKEEALELIKYAFENVDLEERMEMCPGMNEPVVDENYLEAVDEYDAAKQVYEAQLAAAQDDADKRQIENDWNAYDAEMQDFFAVYKYNPSPRSIAAYRKAVKDTITPIYATTISREEYHALNARRKQFLNGEITADQYIDELERRFVMRTREGE